MSEVVARRGLAGATIADIASAAGLQRTLVLHYFGNRDSLLASFITEEVAAYGDRMLGGGPDAADAGTGPETIEARLDALFEPGAYRNREDLVVWVELVALGARDATVRERLSALWTDRWLPEIVRQLAAAHPAADPERIDQVAYALACLGEAHWAFELQGVGGPKRRRQAREAAHTLLATLR